MQRAWFLSPLHQFYIPLSTVKVVLLDNGKEKWIRSVRLNFILKLCMQYIPAPGMVDWNPIFRSTHEIRGIIPCIQEVTG